MLKRVDQTALATIVLLAGPAAVGAVTGMTTLTLAALAGQVVAAGFRWHTMRSGDAGELGTTALQAAISDVSEDAVLLDADQRIVVAGAGCRDLLGMDVTRMTGRRLGDLVHSGDTADYRGRVLGLLTGPPGTTSRWQVRGAADGDHPLWLELTARTVHHDDRQYILVMLRDASEGEQVDPVVHDELTGLVTGTEFFRQASRATAAAGPEHQAAILFCDLDGFDGVNDVYGRPAGDEVLRSVAARLRQALRPHELIGRIGGDEFGVLLPGPVRRGDAEAVATRLQAAVATPITLRAGDLVAVPMDIVVTLVSEPTPHAETIVPQTKRTSSRTLTRLT